MINSLCLYQSAHSRCWSLLYHRHLSGYRILASQMPLLHHLGSNNNRDDFMSWKEMLCIAPAKIRHFLCIATLARHKLTPQSKTSYATPIDLVESNPIWKWKGGGAYGLRRWRPLAPSTAKHGAWDHHQIKVHPPLHPHDTDARLHRKTRATTPIDKLLDHHQRWCHNSDEIFLPARFSVVSHFLNLEVETVCIALMHKLISFQEIKNNYTYVHAEPRLVSSHLL
jgi:hypothetical protein